MTQEELIKVLKYIVKKCDMLINNDNYEADDYTQDTVEDIAELCNNILDGDYGKLVEVKENSIDVFVEQAWDWIENNLLSPNQQDKSRSYCKQFRNYMKGE